MATRTQVDIILKRVQNNHYVMAKHLHMEELNAEVRKDFLVLAEYIKNCDDIGTLVASSLRSINE